MTEKFVFLKRCFTACLLAVLMFAGCSTKNEQNSGTVTINDITADTEISVKF